MDDLIISVFCKIDNFCKEFIPYMEQQCIQTGDKPVPLELPSRLTLSGAMTICAVFHLSGYRTFKWFYQELVLTNYKKFFPNIVSYNRFVELMPYTAFPMVFFAYSRSGKCTGTSFVDSQLLMYVTTIGYNSTKYLKILHKEVKAPQDGFMVSNFIFQ